MGHRDRRVCRTALCQVHGLIEQLQRTVDRHDECHNDDRFQKRNGDMPEGLPAVRAVDMRCLIDGVFDVLQACQIEDHIVAGPPPDQRKNNDEPRRGWRSEPVDFF